MPSSMTYRRATAALISTILMVLGCVTPPDSDPDAATIWGFVRLVPRAGTSPSEGGYGDRRLAHVKRFDYSRLRYAVINIPHVENPELSATELAIVQTLSGPRILPPIGSADPAAGLRIRNDTDRPQLISVPEADWLGSIEPGLEVRIADLPIGEQTVHLLSAPRESAVSAQIWVATGLRVEAGSSGRYVIRGLGGGRHEVHAWHPRLPPAPPHSIDVVAGETYRVDLEIGVDLDEPQGAKGR